MRRALLFRITLAVAAVAALGGVLVAVAGADDSGGLPDITAPELIARMGDQSRAPAALSGDVSWTNELFGELPFMPDHVAEPAPSPLTASGSGRFWAQDGKVRLESQGQGGDQVVVADARAGTVWTYSFADDTARLYEWAGDDAGRPAEGGSGDGEPGEPEARPSPSPPTPERVSDFLQATARFMAVEVSGQTVAAGRAAYLLTMTPAATDTALGKVEAAIDGETYVPLRLDVVAKGHDAPTLSFRFDRVSFDPVDDAVFAFSPPEGATVERETIESSGEGHGGTALRPGQEGSGGDEADSASEADGAEGDDAEAMKQMRKLARTALLTRAEAAELVDFELAWAREYKARESRWAYVFDEGMPVNALGLPVFDIASMSGVFGGDAVGGDGTDADGDRGDAAGGSPPKPQPVAVLLYGEGFGSIVLAQTKTTAEIREQMKQLPEIVDGIDLGGTQAKAIVTPLGSVVTWEHGGVTLVAAGMVPRADIVEFVRAVQ